MNTASYIANLKPGVTLLEAANAGTSEGAKKGWEHGHHGRLAAAVTGGEHASTSKEHRFAKDKPGSVFHFVYHDEPGSAASDFSSFAKSDGAQGASHVSEPAPIGRSGWKVSYNDTNDVTHHVKFVRPPEGYKIKPEMEAANAGTSEGAKKGWEKKSKHAFGLTDKANKISDSALDRSGHAAAKEAHRDASEAHDQARMAAISEGKFNDAAKHGSMIHYHFNMSHHHDK